MNDDEILIAKMKLECLKIADKHTPSCDVTHLMDNALMLYSFLRDTNYIEDIRLNTVSGVAYSNGKESK